jgi:hypothetical protein
MARKRMATGTPTLGSLDRQGVRCLPADISQREVGGVEVDAAAGASCRPSAAVIAEDARTRQGEARHLRYQLRPPRLLMPPGG